jgi:hypothetical protein
MSKLARALTLAVMLAAISLAGMTTGAQAHTSDDPADATVRRLLARERSAIPSAARPRLLLDEDRSTLLNLPKAAPAQATSPEPSVQPTKQAGSRIPALAVLAAVLALVAGVAVLATRRANRTQRASQTA